MADFSKESEFLLKNKIFNSLINSEAVQIARLNAVIALLIKTGIPFDVQFTPGTRRIPKTAVLTVFLSSNAITTASVQFELRFID